MGTSTSDRGARECAVLLAYAATYVAYLFVHPESEFAHWVTLVILPACLVVVTGRYRSLSELARTAGLVGTWRNGWLLAVPLALAFQVLQLMNRVQRATIVSAFSRPNGWTLIPLAFLLLVATAATTEEFFFRGLVQARLARLFKWPLVAPLAGTFLFILYHVPYAYLTWPSGGNLRDALSAAIENGLVAGVPLAILFWRSRQNLLAVIFVHASIDLLPAVRLLAAR